MNFFLLFSCLHASLPVLAKSICIHVMKTCCELLFLAICVLGVLMSFLLLQTTGNSLFFEIVSVVLAPVVTFFYFYVNGLMGLNGFLNIVDGYFGLVAVNICVCLLLWPRVEGLFPTNTFAAI